MKRSLFSIAALCAVHSAMNSASAVMLTDTRHDAGAIPLSKANSGICFIGENDDNVASGQDIGTVSGGGVNDGNNQSNDAGQQDQANEAGNAQQGNPDDAGERQQDQSNDAGQQANSTATDTAAGKADTDESVDGRQPE